MTIKQQPVSGSGQRGMSLVELMVAMVLGLLVTGSAIAIFGSNRQTYATSESLGRIQENARIAYELMARDIRAAGGTPCDRNNTPVNVATAAGAKWWQTWGGGLIGYPKGTVNAAILPSNATSDVIQIMTADMDPVTVVSHSPSTHVFQLNKIPNGFSPLDLALVCDYAQSTIFQVKAGGVDKVANKISYETAGLNCTTDLSRPANCGSGADGVQFANNAMLARVRVVQWYVAPNTHGGSSLFQRQRLDDAANNIDVQEVAEGVSAMTVTYLVNGATDYAAASGAIDWSNVIAVKIVLALQGGEGQETASVKGGVLTRTLNNVVSIRNHAK